MIRQISNKENLNRAYLQVKRNKGTGGVDHIQVTDLEQVLQPVFEADFQRHSYGFGPLRNAHQALRQSLKNINEGYQDIVDIDLKSFFDEVDHNLLLELIYKKVNCDKTMKLIRSFLRAPIQIDGKLVKRRKGVPQGSPLSPLLSNIVTQRAG